MAEVMARASLLALFATGEDTIRLGPPIRATGKFLGTLDAEQSVIGVVGDPCLALGRACCGPGREPGIADGFGHLAHLLGTAPAMFDHALEVVGALFLPIDAGI